jgi:hypothetical protein
MLGARVRYVVHEDPVLRAERNYIAQADLAPFDLDGQIEQLWLLPSDDGTYSVACTPFMTYGLALGDRVRLSAKSRVMEVVEASGHRVLRIARAAPGFPTAGPEHRAHQRCGQGRRTTQRVARRAVRRS